MPRKCLVCGHEKRQEIDKALVEGDTLREITRRFQIDKSAAWEQWLLNRDNQPNPGKRGRPRSI